LLAPALVEDNSRPPVPFQSLENKSIALLFSKRSTRTRLSAETSAILLGGRALFLGHDDIQQGVNENVRDSARVIGGMCQGIFARVGAHHEIEVCIHVLTIHSQWLKIILLQELAKYSPVPVLNALSSLWHPTQILADLLTLHEHAHLFTSNPASPGALQHFPSLPSLNVAYIGDSANVLHDMLVTYPRMGHKLKVASPPKQRYQCPPEVWARVQELGCDKNISWGSDPREAVQGADVVVTDTW
jgi:ornithine carbamoyltransferase